jgi:hypothetical protein
MAQQQRDRDDETTRRRDDETIRSLTTALDSMLMHDPHPAESALTAAAAADGGWHSGGAGLGARSGARDAMVVAATATQPRPHPPAAAPHSNHHHPTGSNSWAAVGAGAGGAVGGRLAAPTVASVHAQLVQLSAEFAIERSRWREAVEEASHQAAADKHETMQLVQAVRDELRAGLASQSGVAARARVDGDDDDDADDDASGPRDFREMKVLLRATGQEFDELKESVAAAAGQDGLKGELALLGRKVSQLDAQLQAAADGQQQQHHDRAGGDGHRPRAVATDSPDPTGAQRLAGLVEKLAARVQQLEEDRDELFWEEHSSPAGQPYYFNTKTQQSTWTAPPAVTKSTGQPQYPALESESDDGEKQVGGRAGKHTTAAQLRLDHLEKRVDEWEMDAANGKTAAATQMRGLQAELSILAGQIGDKVPHLAFADDLSKAREQYSRFNRFSEHLVNEFAQLKER